MTKKELIERLKDFPDDTEVVLLNELAEKTVHSINMVQKVMVLNNKISERGCKATAGSIKKIIIF